MIHFVIGTRAQLFKMVPIMQECNKRKLAWRWIYTAQHKETIQETLDTFSIKQPDCTVVGWNTEAKTMGKIWIWFTKIMLSLLRGRTILDGHTGRNNIVLTHGDTLTTWWGALLGKLYGCKVMHVESGLRSFNLFKPFPEEINRLITFRLSNYYACPGVWALSNIRKYKGVKINTLENTQLDTIRFGLENYEKADIKIPKSKYAVCSIHRYENVYDEDRFSKIIDLIVRISKEYTICWVQHPVTESRLSRFENLKERLVQNENILLYPRLEYLPFIKLIKGSDFVITDGGGNQEELYHMGIPTLIFRNETERKEGIGKTAVVSRFDIKLIEDFMNNLSKYKKPATLSKQSKSPSGIIVDLLESHKFGGI